VVLADTNFLYCDGGTYALCFFSGPPQPTGKPRDRGENRPLPCVLDASGAVASCTCQLYTSGPYFVDVNGILNLGAYFETVQACGADGAGCQNLGACGKDGSRAGCASLPAAPVCRYVRDQNPRDASVSLIPGADLVSAFSFAMEEGYRMGSTTCEPGLYAGCMTAPCYLPAGASHPPSDGDPVQCRCPTYDGVYQVGQLDQQCSIPDQGATSYVWSAANRVK
jgi:hypothetical protein